VSQHISGNLGQSVRHEFGEFIEMPHKYSNSTRVRVEQIISYTEHDNSHLLGDPPAKNEERYVLSIRTTHDNLFLPYETREELAKAAAKLDWIFKKKQQAEGL
jgi:hypothetical protein